ncbi:MAG: hypothetical protein WCB18_02770 [Thermoplasmata archaeon]
MARARRWRRGWSDIGPLALIAAPMLLWTFLGNLRGGAELVVVVGAVGVALSLKHLLPIAFEELALLPIVVALLVEVSTLPLNVVTLILAAASGVGLLLWAGADPDSDVTLAQQLEPALVPALAVAVAVAVTFFLPGGTGGQVGLAALVLVVVLALSAWLYVQSAAEVGVDRPTP